MIRTIPANSDYTEKFEMLHSINRLWWKYVKAMSPDEYKAYLEFLGCEQYVNTWQHSKSE